MAKLHITVFARAARDASNGLMPMPMAPPLAEDHINIGLESVQCDPFSQDATFVMIKAEADCCLAFGKDPVAEDGVHPVSAGEVRWYGVFPGHSIAAIEESPK